MTYVLNMIHICPNNLPLWQSMTKPQKIMKYKRSHKSLNSHSFVKYNKIYPTQTLEKFCKKRVHGMEDFDNLYFWNILNKTHQGILVWNRNKILHTINKMYAYKERKVTTYEEIGESVITTSSNIYK